MLEISDFGRTGIALCSKIKVQISCAFVLQKSGGGGGGSWRGSYHNMYNWLDLVSIAPCLFVVVESV